MKDALKFHIEFMIEKGIEVPKSKGRIAEFVKINYTLPKKNNVSLA